MKVELVDLEEFSGNKAHIYSVLLDDAEDTLFDQFVEENGPLYPNEIREIVKELIAMGNKVGCQEHFFKLNEGRLGDGVAAVWAKRIRVYCLRYGSSLIILGGGGYNSPSIRAYQEDPVLSGKVEEIKRIAELINERIKEKDLKLNEDGIISGELIINDYEEN